MKGKKFMTISIRCTGSMKEDGWAVDKGVKVRTAGGGKMEDGVKYDGSKQNGKQGDWLDRREWSV